jgi:hypothetical protein
MPKKAIAKVDSGRADDNVVCGGHERKIAQVLKSARKKSFFAKSYNFLLDKYNWGAMGGAQRPIEKLTPIGPRRGRRDVSS